MDFLHESSQSGAFCISAAILIYLQVLLPIFSISGGDRAATTEEDINVVLQTAYRCGMKLMAFFDEIQYGITARYYKFQKEK